MTLASYGLRFFTEQIVHSTKVALHAASQLYRRRQISRRLFGGRFNN